MNHLDINGFDWYNPAPNTSIVSMIALLNEAIFYRRVNLDPKTWPFYNGGAPTPYVQFDRFITGVSGLMGSHGFLIPSYKEIPLASFKERVDKIKQNEPFLSDTSACSIAPTIYDWEDLEIITGEDLSIFKDEKLRVNEVWPTSLLTKMYKIVSAFSIKRAGGNSSHLIGEFIDIDTFTDYDTGLSKDTAQGFGTTDFYQSYADGGYSISIDPDLAYDEFVDNMNIRQSKTIELTTQINGGVFGDSNFFPSSKSWYYVRNRNFISGTNLAGHRYQVNQSLTYANACPLSPKFSRGNSTNIFQSQTEYYQYGQKKDIDNIKYYEYFCFDVKSNDNVDFGTGVSLYDGGVLEYKHNENSTLETDAFVNFDYVNSNLEKDPNMSLDIPTYGAQDGLTMLSSTFADINDNPYNEYKTVSQDSN